MPTILHLKPDESQELTNRLNALLEAEKDSPLSRFSCFFSSIELIDRLVHTTSSLTTCFAQTIYTTETQKTVDQIISYINVHLNEPITLSQIADFCHLNPDYTARLFRLQMQTTLGRYITIQKMAKARLLLQQGYTVTQVQEMTGYMSYAHFFRTFKKHTGITPGEYRKS